MPASRLGLRTDLMLSTAGETKVFRSDNNDQTMENSTANISPFFF
jgi:hypothetical protein